MKFVPILVLVVFISVVSQAAIPKDDDELLYLPKGTQLINLRDILVPPGQTQVFFQNGVATLTPEEINGNLRYCFMLLKVPSTKERILEKEVAIVTSGTYRSVTNIIELEITQPTGIFDVGCINGPKDFNKKPTIGQFKKEVQGVFEVVMPGPDPIH